jgi:signal transduction histidine kinase
VLAVGILAGAVLAGHRHLQRVVRAQLINRDGEILYAVARARQFSDPATDLAQRLQSRAEQLALALDISRIKDGVFGVRLFDADGQFVTACPANVTEATLDPAARAALGQLRPLSRYHKLAALADFCLMDPSAAAAPSNTLPLLEVNIPIHAPDQNRLLASAQLLVDGRDLALQAAALDRQLRLEAWALFLSGSALLSGILLWGYRRLERANQLLHERTERLLRANHELTLAAKTTALGAVTAHLIHGLSNPLSSLQFFMSAHGDEHPGDDDWQQALAATRRMHELVDEVVRVLGEQDPREYYEITFEELVGVLEAKVRPAAQDYGVRWETRVSVQGRLSNHHANVVLLILENLVSNAVQVTPRGRAVRASFLQDGPGIVCEIADEGPGFPKAALPKLFVPCRSTKGGTGLGLAISKQLADHIQASLELKRNGPGGCVMVLKLPAALFASRTRQAPAPAAAATT